MSLGDDGGFLVKDTVEGLVAGCLERELLAAGVTTFLILAGVAFRCVLVVGISEGKKSP